MLIFRLPFGKEFYTNDPETPGTAAEFISFSGDRNIIFKGKQTLISGENMHRSVFPFPQDDVPANDETKEEYLEKISRTIEFIKEKHLSKLVISRRKTFPFPGLDIPATFEKLCKAYPSAFVYAFSTGKEAWIGAFSELLGKFNKKTSEFQTMSLAGTLPLQEDWTEKEIEEQKPVTRYIEETLLKYAENVEKSATYDHISGNIKHLRTDFTASVKAEDYDRLIAELHPTPAVCGIPKDLCKTAIAALENFDRGLYAGYSRIETEDYIYSFVNLRCGRIYSDAVQMYAGGGITAMSSPEKEWQETELKMQALQKNLTSF